MSKDEAVKALTAAGARYRFTSEEGKSFFGTADVQHHRVNLTIEGGVVTKVTYG